MNFYLYAMLKSAQDRFSITGELKKKKKIIKEAEKECFSYSSSFMLPPEATVTQIQNFLMSMQSQCPEH